MLFMLQIYKVLNPYMGRKRAFGGGMLHSCFHNPRYVTKEPVYEEGYTYSYIANKYVTLKSRGR